MSGAGPEDFGGDEYAAPGESGHPGWDRGIEELHGHIKTFALDCSKLTTGVSFTTAGVLPAGLEVVPKKPVVIDLSVHAPRYLNTSDPHGRAMEFFVRLFDLAKHDDRLRALCEDYAIEAYHGDSLVYATKKARDQR